MTRTTHPLLRRRAREATASSGRPGSTDRRLRVVPAAPLGTHADPGAPDLALQIRRDGGRPMVVVSGELDLAGKELLEAVLAHVRSTETGSIEVDLGEVTFADTHGLAPTLRRDVVLVAVSPAVARLLRLLGMPLPRSRPLGTRRRRSRPSGRS